MSFKGYIGVGHILAAGIATAGLSLGILGFAEALYYAPSSGLALAYGFGLYGLLGVAAGLALALLPTYFTLFRPRADSRGSRIKLQAPLFCGSSCTHRKEAGSLYFLRICLNLNSGKG